MATADERCPRDLRYHEAHAWARIEEEGLATFGITWFAQEALGEVVFLELPAIGTNVAAGAPYAEVESVKALSDVVAPLSGAVVAVNDALADGPEAINDDPYGGGWLVRVRLSEPSGSDELLDAASYAARLD